MDLDRADAWILPLVALLGLTLLALVVLVLDRSELVMQRDDAEAAEKKAVQERDQAVAERDAAWRQLTNATIRTRRHYRVIKRLRAGLADAHPELASADIDDLVRQFNDNDRKG